MPYKDPEKRRECGRTANRKYWAANSEKVNAQRRAANPEKRRARQTKYRAANPEQYAAHVAVGVALRSGRLIPQPCEVCGTTEDVHGHHDSYEPEHHLDVRWLCRRHHAEHHRQLNASTALVATA